MRDANATGFCTWSSAILLARRMIFNPDAYFPRKPTPLRVLELGSGTGLAGIGAVKALQYLRRPAQVSVSDYDTSTLEALSSAVEANCPGIQYPEAVLQVSILKLVWEDSSTFPIDEFDVILAADILYEPEHAALIYNVLKALLSHKGTFHLVIPIRHTHAGDVDTFEKLLSVPEGRGCDLGRHLSIFEQETIERRDEEQYSHRLYCIKWMDGV